ncbi:cyclase family protein [Hutsoniella sourekii]
MYPIHKLLDQLKEYEWINLTHPVTKDMPVYHAFDPLIEEQLTTLEETGSNNKQYTIGTSHGTHIDAPEHFVGGLRKLEDLSTQERALPLYVLHLEAEVKENPDYSVSIEDILAFEEKYGQIPAGSFVAFSSGWHHRFDTAENYENPDSDGVQHTPGWSVPALEFLSRERQITAIGHESLNTDTGVEAAEAGDLVAQRFWLGEDKYQVENMANLDQVPAVGSIIIVAMPHIQTAPAFPCEAYAIAPERRDPKV